MSRRQRPKPNGARAILDNEFKAGFEQRQERLSDFEVRRNLALTIATLVSRIQRIHEAKRHDFLKWSLFSVRNILIREIEEFKEVSDLSAGPERLLEELFDVAISAMLLITHYRRERSYIYALNEIFSKTVQEVEHILGFTYDSLLKVLNGHIAVFMELNIAKSKVVEVFNKLTLVATYALLTATVLIRPNMVIPCKH